MPCIVSWNKNWRLAETDLHIWLGFPWWAASLFGPRTCQCQPRRVHFIKRVIKLTAFTFEKFLRQYGSYYEARLADRRAYHCPYRFLCQCLSISMFALRTGLILWTEWAAEIQYSSGICITKPSIPEFPSNQSIRCSKSPRWTGGEVPRLQWGRACRRPKTATRGARKEVYQMDSRDSSPFARALR